MLTEQARPGDLVHPGEQEADLAGEERVQLLDLQDLQQLHRHDDPSPQNRAVPRHLSQTRGEQGFTPGPCLYGSKLGLVGVGEADHGALLLVAAVVGAVDDLVAPEGHGHAQPVPAGELCVAAGGEEQPLGEAGQLPGAGVGTFTAAVTCSCSRSRRGSRVCQTRGRL